MVDRNCGLGGVRVELKVTICSTWALQPKGLGRKGQQPAGESNSNSAR